MKDTLFLLFKVVIENNYQDVQDAIGQVQSNAKCQVTSTRNVKVLEVKMLNLKTKRK